jgi:alkylation response protein AidB-like acyl-CoA dehydrogenase
VSFLLADMATQVEAARALYLSAARRATPGSRSAPRRP